MKIASHPSWESAEIVSDHCRKMCVVPLQGWQMLPHDETSFFAAVNLPLLDFNSRTGPQAGFDTG